MNKMEIAIRIIRLRGILNGKPYTGFGWLKGFICLIFMKKTFLIDVLFGFEKLIGESKKC